LSKLHDHTIPKADVRQSKFLVQELMQETCIQVAYTAIQVSHKRNMLDDRDDDLAVAETIVITIVVRRFGAVGSGVGQINEVPLR